MKEEKGRLLDMNGGEQMAMIQYARWRPTDALAEVIIYWTVK